MIMKLSKITNGEIRGNGDGGYDDHSTIGVSGRQ